MDIGVSKNLDKSDPLSQHIFFVLCSHSFYFVNQIIYECLPFLISLKSQKKSLIHNLSLNTHLQSRKH